MAATKRNQEKLLFEQSITDVIAYTNTGEFLWKPHYHFAMEFHLICQGSWRYFIDGSSYQCRSKSLVIIHKNEVHNCIPMPNPHNKKMTLIFSPKLFAGRSTSAGILTQLKSIHHLKLSEKQAGMVELAIREIAEECRLKEPHWQNAITSIIERLLILLDRVQINGAEKQIEVNPLMQEVLGYLEKTFSEKVTLSELANHFGRSPYSLSRMFKQYVGLGFQNYLIHRRIIEAKCILEQTDLKILAVANAVGFDDLSTFNRNFKLLTGVSPSLYRKIS
ncbi:MAG TPA: hypothetical protein DCL60_12705 [Armatimonadetes bacterium]|nr:hypothetical protein [Armatimonadota bacterium]